MQTTAIRTVANSLPEKGGILLTLLISDRYILFAELRHFFVSSRAKQKNTHEPTISFRLIGKGSRRICQTAGHRPENSHAAGVVPVAAGDADRRGIR